MDEPINIQKLIETRDRILKSIQAIDSKRQTIQSKATLVAPGIDNEIQIKQLELDKIKVSLNKTYKEVDLQIKYESKVITEEEYNLTAQFLSQQESNEIQQINDNIAKLKEKRTVNEFFQADRLKILNKKSAQLAYVDAKTELAYAYRNQIKSLVAFTGKEAIIGVISILINVGLSRLSKEVANLEILVDNVNNVIVNIKTKADVEKAKRLRNNALRLLNSAEKRIKTIEKIVNTIVRVLKIINIVLTILRIVALLPGAPKALLVILMNISEIVTSLLVILQATQNTLKSLIFKIEELKRRLKEIGDIIDNKLEDPNTNLDTIDVFNITSNNFGKLGLLNINYKGFRFVIKEENNPKFVVQGFKRRYAVAINLDGNDVLFGEPSFTLDPDVLIEQLKLIIDERNLTP